MPSEVSSSEPVKWLKAKYTVLKTKGKNKSKHNDNGQRSRKKTGKTDSLSRERVLFIRRGRRVWEWRDL
ncbi:hypothetical protein [Streptomyces sp. NPDC010273]|uniref:hypothetical protein n=1 Tax=Streptomyces sp. NPDC010273 TaxID=3364829 RepID=UPI0036E11FDD